MLLVEFQKACIQLFCGRVRRDITKKGFDVYIAQEQYKQNRKEAEQATIIFVCLILLALFLKFAPQVFILI